MERAIKERMSSAMKLKILMPDLINAKPAAASLGNFLVKSSQF